MSTQEQLAMEQVEDVRKPPESVALTHAELLPAPMKILEWAKANGIAISEIGEVLKYALDYKREMARLAWIEDMEAFKKDCPEIFKTKKAEAGKMTYWYAELDKACPVIIKSLNEHNFTHRWEAETAQQTITVSCVIQHKLGHSERTTLSGPADTSGGKNGIQAIGSSVTYLERYTLFQALGVVPKGEDSDGVAPGIPLGLRIERCDEIAAAKSIEQLRARYQAAYTEAREQKDNEATILYTEAYEKRKQTLMGEL